jgi:hypothetical protein
MTMAMDPHDPRAIGAVPLLGAVNGQPGGGLMVDLQQPDGSMVRVPIEFATLHVLTEIRSHLEAIRGGIVGDLEVVAEAEGVRDAAD